MIKNTPGNNNYSLLPSSASDCLTNCCRVVENRTNNADHPIDKTGFAIQQLPTPGGSAGPGATDSHADLPSLERRQCSWLDQVNNLHITPGRVQLGGKGMYLTVLEDAGLMVPPFRCIEGSVWQRLENVPLDLSSLLSALEDGHEFGQDTGTLAMIRDWVGAADQQKQRRWLEATSSFVASDN